MAKEVIIESDRIVKKYINQISFDDLISEYVNHIGVHKYTLLYGISRRNCSYSCDKLYELTFDNPTQKMAQLVFSLRALHECGFIHSDIKPDNIMQDADGNVKLIDLEFVNIPGKTISAIYTMGYVPPELQNAETISSLSNDIWPLSLLILEYYNKTGYSLVVNVGEDLVVCSIGQFKKMYLEQINTMLANISDNALQALLVRGLSRNPAARPSINEFTAYYAPFLNDQRYATYNGKHYSKIPKSLLNNMFGL